MKASATALCTFFLLSAIPSLGQTLDEGRSAYMGRCTSCHGTDGNGGEFGPSTPDA